MKRNKFPRIADMKLPLLGFGGMRLPTLEDTITPDIEKVQEMVDYAMANNLNYFDTAFFYHGGKSEVALGEALSKYPRESWYLTDKLPYQIFTGGDGFSGKPESFMADIEKTFNIQLERTGAGYFDFYFIHSMQNGIYQKMLEYPIYEFLQQKKDEGKIKHIGFSFHSTPDVLEKVCTTFQWDCGQIQLNCYDWDFINAKECYEVLERHGVPCFVMEPIRGGNLTRVDAETKTLLHGINPDMSLAAWCLRWVASLPNVCVMNSGMSNMEQLRENIDTIVKDFVPLDDGEWKAMDKMVASIRKATIVPCTGCRYCMPCPFGVDIPGCFAFLNDTQISADEKLSKLMYMRSIVDGAKADNCKKCGMCVKHCPQHIDIPECLELVTKTLYMEGADK